MVAGALLAWYTDGVESLRDPAGGYPPTWRYGPFFARDRDSQCQP
jgi:hypothetical protein